MVYCKKVTTRAMAKEITLWQEMSRMVIMESGIGAMEILLRSHRSRCRQSDHPWPGYEAIVDRAHLAATGLCQFAALARANESGRFRGLGSHRGIDQSGCRLF